MAEEKKMIGTKEMAKKLGIAPGTLRRALRASGKNSGDNKFSRYEWEAGDTAAVAKVQSIVEKHTAQEKEKKSTKKAEKKSAKKAPKKSKKEDDSAIEEV